jgi:hypothetical protein
MSEQSSSSHQEEDEEMEQEQDEIIPTHLEESSKDQKEMPAEFNEFKQRVIKSLKDDPVFA